MSVSAAAFVVVLAEKISSSVTAVPARQAREHDKRLPPLPLLLQQTPTSAVSPSRSAACSAAATFVGEYLPAGAAAAAERVRGFCRTLVFTVAAAAPTVPPAFLRHGCCCTAAATRALDSTGLRERVLLLTAFCAPLAWREGGRERVLFFSWGEAPVSLRRGLLVDSA